MDRPSEECFAISVEGSSNGIPEVSDSAGLVRSVGVSVWVLQFWAPLSLPVTVFRVGNLELAR